MTVKATTTARPHATAPTEQAAAIGATMGAIRQALLDKDPGGLAWPLRVLTVQRMFHIVNEPRFRLEPADLDRVSRSLDELLAFVKDTPAWAEKPRAPGASLSERERDRRMQVLYGIAWARLSDAEYADAADLLRRRIAGSNFSTDFLDGALCCDVGTGIARFALAMVQLGAEYVLGFDFSEECLDEGRRRLARLPEADQIELRWEDIYKLPADLDEAFDFVCANGVIHHMPDPAESLRICHRLTKRGGRMFVFVFAGNDSPWWKMIEIMREVMAPVPIEYAAGVLRHSAAAGAHSFNVLDYSYTPIQFKHPATWYEDVFAKIGFSQVHRLRGGAIHDSELRSRLYETDQALYGVSEVRYLLQK
jgi:SAM-dependent methyltransferase